MSEDEAAATPEAVHRHTLPGSERAPLPGAEKVADLSGEEQIQVTLVLRRRAELPEDLPGPLSRDELAERYGADPADIEAVTRTVRAAGGRVVSADPASRRVLVGGSASILQTLFGTRLEVATAPDRLSGREVRYRAREGTLSVPGDLQGVVTAVLGLDDRPQARARLQSARAEAVSVSYTPPELGKVYRFPVGTDGSGQRVAIIELGGGFAQSDLDAYFSGLGLSGPKVTAVGVDGADNQPGGDPNGADGEVLLDIEVVGALAPGATVLVYFAPNTDAGFLDAVSDAAHAQPAPAAISISWGQSEDGWTGQARQAMDAAFADAAALGVTVTAAAGDDGSTDRATDQKAHCDFPASSPHALACGGTSLQADPADGSVTSEVVWNNGTGRGATGGGVSDTFPLPSWQRGAGVPARAGGQIGRGVPDVSGDADPRTGYDVLIDGTRTVIGGTSAVAPLWAALTARLVQALGRPLGQMQPVLYAGVAAGVVQPGFRDIVTGSNGQYQAGAGWDACTGLGVPDGDALLAVLRGHA
ncbi:kumamolisin [Nakamurella panacisegetis]|uniref:Kumamolisin n=1 Tax=Nakamurella panacisegetis TaxID=1090615 RepID=A0A1H0SI73_9ACTN|nr:S53 family peptidase [Nakamurella panacisegetis]SDP41229.1 kumamolisin [Nakamurella panacisegetis]